jgi:hypothetical protein
VWLFVSSYNFKKKTRKGQTPTSSKKVKPNYFTAVLKGFIGFGQSFYIGGKIILTNRKFFWLFTCYSLTIYAHRYLEDSIAPQVARRYLAKSAWSEIIVGGSNFGELLGAFFIFFLSNSIRTPLPWLRLSALVLIIIWYIPFCYAPVHSIKYAWIIALTFIPISFGWAAGDIALTAHIQSSMTRLEATNENVSVLGAVMSFLYSSYVIIYAIANPMLGKYIDQVYHFTGTIRPALVYTAGVQFTVIMIIVFVSTFIPTGAFAFNPSIPDEEDSSSTDDNDDADKADVLIG